MSATNTIPFLKSNSAVCQQQDWKTLDRFDAKTSLSEKVCRVANGLTLGLAAYGAYSLWAGPFSWVPVLGLALGARKAASTTFGYLAYPKALESTVRLSTKSALQNTAQAQITALKEEGYNVRKIRIVKSGTSYDASLITHAATVDNGRWTLNALGNGMAMEEHVWQVAKENMKYGSNTLLVNGPSVGESGGWPTRYQLGAGLEGALQFLEQEVKATHIAMRGLSLGGGMMAEAILNHDFTEGQESGVQYLSISDRTFSRLSDIAGAVVLPVVKPIFYLSNTELDGVGAARKLCDLRIQHIVIQHERKDDYSGDGVIPDNTSLAYILKQENILDNKQFLESGRVGHNGPLPQSIQACLDLAISEFFHVERL